MKEEIKISRRKVINGIGAGLASAAMAPVLSVEGAPNVAAATAAPLENPAEKYPKPPFKGQSQPWPGLAGKMEPLPDHG